MSTQYNRITLFSKSLRYAMNLWGLFLIQAMTASGAPTSELAIKGLVLDASTGLPVADIPVTLTEPITRRSYSFKTKFDGAFAFSVQYAEQFMLNTEETPETLYSSVKVKPAVGALSVEAKLLVQRAGRVSGRVIGTDGKGAGGVRVQLRIRGFRDALPAFSDQRNRIADEEGKFSFTGLNPGSYLMSAIPKLREVANDSGNSSKGGVEYIPAITYYPSGETPLDATHIELAYGQSIDHLELRMRKSKPSCLAFSVESPDELALPGLLIVSEKYIGSQSSVVGGPIRSKGSNRVCGLPEGSYRFALRFNTMNGEARYAAQEVEAVNGKEVTVGKVSLSPLATYRGVVLVEKQQSQGQNTLDQVFKGLNLRLEPTDRLQWDHERIDSKPSADGSFEFKAIGEDSYRLRVDGLAQGVYVKAMSAGPNDLLANALTDTSHKISVNLATDGPIVRGVVRGQYETFKSGCLVSIVDASATVFTRSNFATTRSSEDGSFTLTSIAPGQYKLWGSCDFVPYSKVSDPERLRGVQKIGTTIQVSGSQTATFDIVVK